jgi:hypothetical protein
MTESDRISINRAPVMTLWAAVVAERLGYDREESLTLGRAVAGLNAASKARTLGIVKPAEKSKRKREPGAGTALTVELLERAIPVARTRAGLRAIDRGGKPSDPDAVVRYLEGKFGDSLGAARRAMTALAASLPPRSLAERAHALYESFRPAIPAGVAGWGARGVLDLGRVRALAGTGRRARGRT